jgi:hypothetical protein
LSGGFYQPLPSRTKDVAAVEFDLMTQLVDRMLLLLDGLLVELGSLIECSAVIVEGSLKVRDLLSVLTQQVVAFAGISGP